MRKCGLDWDDLRSFLALSERGSISGRGEVFEREPFSRAPPARKLEKTVLTLGNPRVVSDQGGRLVRVLCGVSGRFFSLPDQARAVREPRFIVRRHTPQRYAHDLTNRALVVFRAPGRCVVVPMMKQKESMK